MSQILDLLKEKNGYLEKFLGLNCEWINRLAQNDYGQVEGFRENRERILNIINRIDDLLYSLTFSLDPESFDFTEKKEITTFLDRKDSLVKAILAQDLEIMQFIETAKGVVYDELKKVSKSKKTIGSYKSFKRNDNIDEEF